MKAEPIQASKGMKFVLTAYGLQTNERGSNVCREWFNNKATILFTYQKWLDKGWVKEVAR